MVRMSELSHQDNTISLQLNIRNINGVDLGLLDIDVSMSINEDEQFTYAGPVNTVIVANGTETWSVDIRESETTRELLDSLQNGDVQSLPYVMKGSISTAEDGTLRFEYEGHIYPLPGRPGQFR